MKRCDKLLLIALLLLTSTSAYAQERRVVHHAWNIASLASSQGEAFLRGDLNNPYHDGPVRSNNVLNAEGASLNSSIILTSIQNPAPATSEMPRQMSAAWDASGKRVFTAYATKLNAAHQLIVRDKNGDIVPLAAGVANSDLYHHFDRLIIFVKKPGSDSQYYLITQLSNGGSDFIYRHTLDASRPGNGTWEEPLGEIIQSNYLLHTNNNALRYGASVQALQNTGSDNTTWIYFLRSSVTQVQLTGRVLNSNGTFGSSLSTGAVNGTPIGSIKFSPDGKQLLMAYLPPAVLNQVQFSMLRRYGIGLNGELTLIEEKSLSKDLLEFEFSPDGRFIYYGLAISETPPAGLSRLAARPGTKFRIRRWDLVSQNDELVGDSYNDEIFNGKHLALLRSANGRIYISAAGHRRMMVINDPCSAAIPSLSGEAIADNDPNKAPYLSGAFATIAFDHHFHTIPNNGTFYARRNKRQYELKDHLENVNVVVSDMRASDGSAVVLTSNTYYPYGMIMPGRSYNSADYRYGFNGMEKDDELKGTGNSYDFGARIYDPRVARWLTRDPLADEYAAWSPYVPFLDNPILYVDPDGKAPKRYILVAVEFEIIGSRTMGSEAVLIVWDKNWRNRAKAMMVNSRAKVHVTYVKEIDTWDSLSDLMKEWDGLQRFDLNEEIRGVDNTLDDAVDGKPVKSKLAIEDEVLRDYNNVMNARGKHSVRRGGPKTLVPRLKGPGGKGATVNLAVDLIENDREVGIEEAGGAVVMAFAPPIVDIMRLEGDQPDFAADYEENSRARESLRYYNPQCFDSWFNFFRVRSDYCDDRFEQEKEYVREHPPGKHWFIQTTEQVQEAIRQSKKE